MDHGGQGKQEDPLFGLPLNPKNCIRGAHSGSSPNKQKRADRMGVRHHLNGGEGRIPSRKGRGYGEAIHQLHGSAIV